MKLFPELSKRYTDERLSAREAQRLAEFIAWGPAVFQVARLMIKFGILDMLRDSDEGLTLNDITEKTGLSEYAVKCLLEASLCIGTIIVDADTDRYTISKTGWFLLNDPATRVNIDFNHDGGFSLTDEEGTVIAEAELGIESEKVVFFPFDDHSRVIFTNEGYSLLTPEEYLTSKSK